MLQIYYSFCLSFLSLVCSGFHSWFSYVLLSQVSLLKDGKPIPEELRSKSDQLSAVSSSIPSPSSEPLVQVDANSNISTDANVLREKVQEHFQLLQFYCLRSVTSLDNLFTLIKKTNKECLHLIGLSRYVLILSTKICRSYKFRFCIFWDKTCTYVILSDLPCLIWPYLALSDLTLSYVTLPYLTLPSLSDLTLSYLTLPRLFFSDVPLPYLTLPYFTLPYLILAWLIWSYLALSDLTFHCLTLS